MNVLINCEYSGIVRDAFIARGHNAWSCDLLPTESPGPHIQGDALLVAYAGGWDLMIAHPPCTYLASSGLHWNTRTTGRAEKTTDALNFVRALLNAPIEKIGLENPVGCISSAVRKPDQIIQPWMFGEDASKATCLWLKNLPKLKVTNVIEGALYCCGIPVSEGAGFYGCANCNGEKKAKRIYANQTPSGQNKLSPSADRWKLRSTTYRGIAAAMADQWNF